MVIVPIEAAFVMQVFFNSNRPPQEAFPVDFVA